MIVRAAWPLLTFSSGLFGHALVAAEEGQLSSNVQKRKYTERVDGGGVKESVRVERALE